MRSFVAIAIDGPAGGGKGTIAQHLAQSLGFLYVDTGAMYRAVAWLALHRGISLEDEEAISALARSADIRFLPQQNDQSRYRILINGHDVTEAIREPQVDRGSSIVAQYPEVRQVLVEKQRNLAQSTHVVMEGRDITTVVLPDADVKLFITASLEERARRRYIQRVNKGIAADLSTIQAELAERDKRDTERQTAPMRVPKEAIVIDTTNQQVEYSVHIVLRLVRNMLER